MSKRISRAEYDAFFNENVIVTDSSPEAGDKGKKRNIKKREALKYALEIRSFEIDLYWKRATYFWAFIGATLTGYGVVQASQIPSKVDLSVALACLGLVFSFGWFCANKGSKQWQENWENHVDLLEDDITGPLYKVVVRKAKPKWYSLRRLERLIVGPARFSVSKINQIISLFVTALWGFLLWMTLQPSPTTGTVNWKHKAMIAAAAIACFLFLCCGRTSDKEEKSKGNEKGLVAFMRDSRIGISRTPEQ
jgi:hypothetical protein